MDPSTKELFELITILCGQPEADVRTATTKAQQDLIVVHQARGDLSNEIVIDVANAMERMINARVEVLLAAMKKALGAKPVDSSPETAHALVQFLVDDLGVYFSSGSEQITKTLAVIGYFDGTPPTLGDAQESVRFRVRAAVNTALAAMPRKVVPPPVVASPPPQPTPTPEPAPTPAPPPLAPAPITVATSAPSPSLTTAPMPLRAVESKKPGYDARVYRVTIASPAEVIGERDMVRDVVHEWNAVNSLSRKLALLSVGWDTDVALEPGARSPVKDSDLLIAMFWTRMGAAAAEIREHLAAGKPAMVYFCTAAPTGPVDADQQAGLKSFRAQCKELGLVQLFENAGQLKDLFGRQLEKRLSDEEKFPGLV